MGKRRHVNILLAAIAIADRIAQESIDIAYPYAHVFPSTQIEVASKSNTAMAK